MQGALLISRQLLLLKPRAVQWHQPFDWMLVRSNCSTGYAASYGVAALVSEPNSVIVKLTVNLLEILPDLASEILGTRPGSSGKCPSSFSGSAARNGNCKRAACAELNSFHSSKYLRCWRILIHERRIADNHLVDQDACILRCWGPSSQSLQVVGHSKSLVMCLGSTSPRACHACERCD